MVEKKNLYVGMGILFMALFALIACATPAPTVTPMPTPTPTPLTPEPFTLTVLYTNDGWGYTEPCACDPSVGGLARRAAFIKAIRQEKENILVVDAGDSLLSLFHVGDLEQGKLLAESFNQMGYDAVAIGGMDFRMGLDVLREQIKVANYAILSANTLDPTTQSFFDRDYQIVEMHGHRIALIGLTDPQIASQVTQGQVSIAEPVQSLMDLVETLKKEADIIIVLSHLGTQYDINLGMIVKDIDLVVSGRDKELYTEALKVHDYLIVSAGSRGEYVGQIDLDFDAEGHVISHQLRLQIMTEEIADDPDMRKWLGASGLISSTALKSGNEGQVSP